METKTRRRSLRIYLDYLENKVAKVACSKRPKNEEFSASDPSQQARHSTLVTRVIAFALLLVPTLAVLLEKKKRDYRRRDDPSCVAPRLFVAACS
jgi:hypothetical protein